jgi:hypothetical protein
MYLLCAHMHECDGASVAQSSEQAPFTSEFVGSILATDSCEKSQSTLCRKSIPNYDNKTRKPSAQRYVLYHLYRLHIRKHTMKVSCNFLLLSNIFLMLLGLLTANRHSQKPFRKDKKGMLSTL